MARFACVAWYASDEQQSRRGFFSGRLAERRGFEPLNPCGLSAFEADAIDHSAISPEKWALLYTTKPDGPSPADNG